jgi:hypothetical protein
LSEIKASPKAIREFFYNCNTDSEFRANFLERPVKFLQAKGISINEDAAGEIESYVDALKVKFGDELMLLPIGWEDHRWELMEEPFKGYGIRIIGDNDPLVIP